jgi:hypothetical protein
MKHAPVNPQDLIIRPRRAGGFVVGTSASRDQTTCRTFEEALAHVGRMVDTTHGYLWYVDDRQPPVRVEQRLLSRVWAEYCELPGLGLTELQAQRLWGVDGNTCAALLEVLVRTELLARGADGRYRRFAEDRAASGARMAKAAPRPRPPLVTTGDRRRHF